MHRSTFLKTVLVLRRHREDAEERLLTAVQRELHEEVREKERIDNEIALLGASRTTAESCGRGTDFHRSDALYQQLRERQMENASRIEMLKHKQTAQLNRYLTARQEREVISALEEKRVHAWKAEIASREIKQAEDLFLARFGRR